MGPNITGLCPLEIRWLQLYWWAAAPRPAMRGRIRQHWVSFGAYERSQYTLLMILTSYVMGTSSTLFNQFFLMFNQTVSFAKAIQDPIQRALNNIGNNDNDIVRPCLARLRAQSASSVPGCPVCC